MWLVYKLQILIFDLQMIGPNLTVSVSWADQPEHIDQVQFSTPQPRPDLDWLDWYKYPDITRMEGDPCQDERDEIDYLKRLSSQSTIVSHQLNLFIVSPASNEGFLTSSENCKSSLQSKVNEIKDLQNDIAH